MKRLVNAQSHFSASDFMSDRLDSRGRIIALKTQSKRFQIQGTAFFKDSNYLERENEISKNNAMLIKNLLEISHGKRVIHKLNDRIVDISAVERNPSGDRAASGNEQQAKEPE